MVALIKGNGPGLGNSAAAVLATAGSLALAAASMAGVGRRIGRRTATSVAPGAAEVTDA